MNFEGLELILQASLPVQIIFSNPMSRITFVLGFNF